MTFFYTLYIIVSLTMFEKKWFCFNEKVTKVTHIQSTEYEENKPEFLKLVRYDTSMTLNLLQKLNNSS